MPLVQRLPYDPSAVDISAIHRRKQLEAWRATHTPVKPKPERFRKWIGFLRFGVLD
jgi:hypothetical protein